MSNSRIKVNWTQTNRLILWFYLPVGGSELRSYFSPFVDQSSPDYVSRRGRDRSLQRRFPIVDILFCSGNIRDRSAKSEIAPKKHFDREYLRNGTIYRQSENGVADYDLSRVRWHNLVNFGPQTKNRTVVWSLHNAKFVFYPKVGVPKLL